MAPMVGAKQKAIQQTEDIDLIIILHIMVSGAGRVGFSYGSWHLLNKYLIKSLKGNIQGYESMSLKKIEEGKRKWVKCSVFLFKEQFKRS